MLSTKEIKSLAQKENFCLSDQEILSLLAVLDSAISSAEASLSDIKTSLTNTDFYIKGQDAHD